MPKPVRIGLDMDGVVADFLHAAHQIIANLYGIECGPQTCWDFTTSYNLTRPQEDHIFEVMRGTSNFWEHLLPLPNCERLREWQHQFDYHFITSSFRSKGLPVAEQKSNWLERHFGIPRPVVILCHMHKKADVIKALDLEAFIDDKPETATDIYRRTDAISYLQNATYNQDRIGGVIRVASVNEYLERVLHHREEDGYGHGV